MAMRHHRAGLALSALFWATASQAAPAGCAEFGGDGQLPVLTNAALGQQTVLLCNDAFAVLHSGISHGPLWTAEHLTEEDLERSMQIGRVVRYFHADPRLSFEDRAELSDYRASSYDRGHMACSADEPSLQAQEQSFSLANVVPQTPELNEGIWTGVEMAVRRLAEREGELYVVTGPAFGASVKTIGSHRVFVPSATWKAVYDPAEDEAGAYFCQNSSQPTCTIISIGALTQATGVDPFPSLPDEIRQTAMKLPRPLKSPYAVRIRPASGSSVLETTP
ncbi:DNA/RNA non-specific endonuclease [Gluconobacter sphaericus]|nr:DNA/RNA non-specific endonuclease [Gluconobacter sphaericus]MBS1101147.1 DNA/RNA non-specific endonuclease [Gluconobacter sphaericus]